MLPRYFAGPLQPRSQDSSPGEGEKRYRDSRTQGFSSLHRVGGFLSPVRQGYAWRSRRGKRPGDLPGGKWPAMAEEADRGRAEAAGPPFSRGKTQAGQGRRLGRRPTRKPWGNKSSFRRVHVHVPKNDAIREQRPGSLQVRRRRVGERQNKDKVNEVAMAKRKAKPT